MKYDEDNIILIDEDNNEVEFEIITKIVVEKEEYFILRPIEDESGEAMVLKSIADGDEISLVSVEDDEEFKMVVEAYETLFSEGLIN